MAKKFPFYKQLDTMDCGATCLRMILEYHSKGKRKYSLQEMRDLTAVTREGVTIKSIGKAAESFGLRPTAIRIDFDSLLDAPTPFVAHWKGQHFVVVTDIAPKKIKVADPAFGIVTYNRQEFESHWGGLQEDGKTIMGIALILEPTPDFYNDDTEKKTGQKLTLLDFLAYLKPYKQLITQLSLGLLMSTMFSFVLPILTQNIVDTGISNKNIPFIYLMLGSLLFITVMGMIVNLFKSFVSTHLSTRLNVAMINDYIAKLTRLPMSFFDTKMTGDLLQRIGDYGRIQALISNTSISTVFSLVNLVILSFMLLFYNPAIYGMFLTGSILYVSWITYFLKRRAKLDYKRFQQFSGNQNQLIQMMQNMQEIKLNNCREQKITEWQKEQATTFKLDMEKLKLNEIQGVGANLINEIKNVCISGFSAMAVVEGQITTGTMFAIAAIIGQLNGPIVSLMQFILSIQDAKLSMERISEIYELPDEEQPHQVIMPKEADIYFKNVSFKYDRAQDNLILDDLTFRIPYGKTTAIVGGSGSGKTTLLKLILKYYDVSPFSKGGGIYFGTTNIEEISADSIRRNCSSVMQDSKIFMDTIARNIAISDEETNQTKLINSIQISDIKSFVSVLPLRYNTKIGGDGQGLSGGQEQRIKIARAVYRNPNYLIFDEATSALDTNTEKKITQNLNQYLRGRTAIIVAHRLSTVKNADQILVLEKGKLVEQGTHQTLVAKKGYYYELIKNQLELGS